MKLLLPFCLLFAWLAAQCALAIAPVAHVTFNYSNTHVGTGTNVAILAAAPVYGISKAQIVDSSGDQMVLATSGTTATSTATADSVYVAPNENSIIDFPVLPGGVVYVRGTTATATSGSITINFFK
jgi:hypothetical protein